jgi:hypothetical protein
MTGPGGTRLAGDRTDPSPPYRTLTPNCDTVRLHWVLLETRPESGAPTERGTQTMRKNWQPIIARAAAIVAGYDTAVTLRQVHYRLVAEAAFGYRNTENDYKNLSRLSAAARREGTFPPLLDRTRAIERPTTFASPAEALEQLARWYRRDLLETQDVLPVIVVEKATLVAQVQSWFDEQFGIPVVALRGYASEALERQVLDLVDGDEREVAFLYAGDFDPTGEDIARAFAENTGLDLRHVALTAAQVQAYGLPPVPGKASDSRAAGFVARHGELVQVELEALDPAELRALLAIQLQLLVDVDRVAQVFVRQDRERVELEELAEGWDAG